MEMSSVTEWSTEAIKLALQLSGPLLVVALVIGLVVGIAQTLMQLHEPVVGLVPRLAGVLVAILVLLPWFMGRWVSFATELIESIPGML